MSAGSLEFPVAARVSGRDPGQIHLGTALASVWGVCMVRPARQRSSDATFDAGEKDFTVTAKKESPDEPRYHDGQGGEREDADGATPLTS